MKTSLILALALSAPSPECHDGGTKLEPLTYAQASEKAAREGKHLVVFVRCKPFDVSGTVSVRDDDYGKRAGWETNSFSYIVVGDLKWGTHIESSRLLNDNWTALEIMHRLPGRYHPTGDWRVRDVPAFSQTVQPLRYLNDSPANCPPRG